MLLIIVKLSLNLVLIFFKNVYFLVIFLIIINLNLLFSVINKGIEGNLVLVFIFRIFLFLKLKLYLLIVFLKIKIEFKIF